MKPYSEGAYEAAEHKYCTHKGEYTQYVYYTHNKHEKYKSPPSTVEKKWGVFCTDRGGFCTDVGGVLYFWILEALIYKGYRVWNSLNILIY